LEKKRYVLWFKTYLQIIQLGNTKPSGENKFCETKINKMLKTLKFRVKCTDTFLFWQKCWQFWKIGEKVVQHQARKYGNQIWNVHQWIRPDLMIWFLSDLCQCIYLHHGS
jgi:hypothetical protein